MGRKKPEENTRIIEKTIISLLFASKQPLTTEEVTKKINRMNLYCPESPSHYLHRLKKKNILESEFSHQKKAIVWSVVKK